MEPFAVLPFSDVQRFALCVLRSPLHGFADHVEGARHADRVTLAGKFAGQVQGGGDGGRNLRLAPYSRGLRGEVGGGEGARIVGLREEGHVSDGRELLGDG